MWALGAVGGAVIGLAVGIFIGRRYNRLELEDLRRRHRNLRKFMVNKVSLIIAVRKQRRRMECRDKGREELGGSTSQVR